MSVLVGKDAPNFTATAVMPDNSFKEDFNLLEEGKGKNIILFFYPLDFTFVCPSEIIAFNNRIKDFEDKNTLLVGCSVDSQFSHYAWKNTDVKKGGIGQVQFPLVADITKQIARDYDVLLGESVSFRGTFLIDQKGIVRHQVVNDLPLGRNVDETLRMIDALTFHESNGEVCPAGWNKGDEGMTASKDGVSHYLEKNAETL